MIFDTKVYIFSRDYQTHCINDLKSLTDNRLHVTKYIGLYYFKEQIRV